MFCKRVTNLQYADINIRTKLTDHLILKTAKLTTAKNDSLLSHHTA